MLRLHSYLEYFEYLKGDSAKNDLFEGLDFSWNRISNNNEISILIKNIVRMIIIPVNM